MKQRFKENPQIMTTAVIVLVIAVLCFIFRYDGEYEGYYQIAAKEEKEGTAYIMIEQEDKDVKLECDRDIYDQLKEQSEEKYYISYKSLRFGNGLGELVKIQVD